jgi:high affinity Mn2+ porin
MTILARIPSRELTQTTICAALFASATALLVGCAEQAKAEERTGAPYTWTGFYVGGQMGYTFGTSRWTASSPGAADVSGSLSFTQPLDPFSETGSFFAGLQGGYNYMLPNRVVIGGEVDATFPTFPDRAGISTGGITNLFSPALGSETYSETMLASDTVRGRIGYAPGNWLFYATGGFTWTYDQLSLTQNATAANESPFLWRLGYAAGAGVEAPIAPHWTARLEYLFTGYGNHATSFFGGAQQFTSDLSLQQVRAGLNYQFGNDTAPAYARPIVTKGAQAAPDLDLINFHGQATFVWQAIRRSARRFRDLTVCWRAGRAARPPTPRCLPACGCGRERSSGSIRKSIKASV